VIGEFHKPTILHSGKELSVPSGWKTGLDSEPSLGTIQEKTIVRA
jgi:hypothetical protein